MKVNAIRKSAKFQKNLFGRDFLDNRTPYSFTPFAFLCYNMINGMIITFTVQLIRTDFFGGWKTFEPMTNL